MTIPYCEGGGRICRRCDSLGDQEQQTVEETTEDNEDHVDLGVVPQLVSKEAHYGRTSEDCEGEDGVDEGHINVTDAQVLHVDSEVWNDGIGCS